MVASLHALPRVGLIVPRHKHSAVDRNRLKRRLRELLRLELLPVLRSLPQPLDVVVRASAPAYGLAFDALQAELQQLGAQIVRRTRVAHTGGDAANGAPDVR